MSSKFIDPLTDFGFKHLFGREPEKDILIDFLNALFDGEKEIVDLAYSPTEFPGKSPEEKKVFFDLTCTGKDGEKFIIEMQKAGQEFFKDRCIYYMSRLISNQLPKGRSSWDEPLKEVYLIAIMNFQFNNVTSDYIHNIALTNTATGKVFYKGIGYKFLELVNFEKQGHELDSDLDKWFYLLKNLRKMDKIPSFLDKRIFEKVFKIAEMAKLTKEEREIYESNMKAKSDYDASLRWAAKQAAIEVAKKLKLENIPVEIIERSTGLSAADIEKL